MDTVLKRGERSTVVLNHRNFFALAFLEVWSAFFSVVIQPQRPLSVSFER